MSTPPNYTQQLDRDGYSITGPLLSSFAVSRLIAAIDALEGRSDQPGLRRNGSLFGVRNLPDLIPEVGDVVDQPVIRELLDPILGPDVRLVRGTLFDKTPDANWGLFWHQDLSIAVREQVDTPGFGPWTRKDGVPCVQAPTDLLANMLTVRIHLDECDEHNGGLSVIPGSHRARLTDADIGRNSPETDPVLCCVPAGGAMVMRPLLLHSSARSRGRAHRRVIHLEFAATDLPGELTWHYQRKVRQVLADG